MRPKRCPACKEWLMESRHIYSCSKCGWGIKCIIGGAKQIKQTATPSYPNPPRKNAK